LEGSLSDQFFSLPDIRRLSVYGNALVTGEIPSNVSGTLQELRLGGTQFGGLIPSTIFNLIDLSELSLEFGTFSGNLSESFVNLQNMALLRLNNNTFTGKIPRAFDQMTHLSK
jgi:hypothetical protein